MAENFKAYTAFQTSRGLMQFNYMPLGLSTAACTFQKAMIDTLGRLDFVASYFDDILIFSHTVMARTCFSRQGDTTNIEGRRPHRGAIKNNRGLYLDRILRTCY
ncbi:Pol polyprotein [Elysia marginata]|uniref:Pol polyprotein n=1 Tax=Elysia marginata TaxID=1093978 RepID=A0AAV4GDC3_9GAST|nr:Pol polyprotein [Elysia marginata]